VIGERFDMPLCFDQGVAIRQLEATSITEIHYASFLNTGSTITEVLVRWFKNGKVHGCEQMDG
jgi:hypothetical protein